MATLEGGNAAGSGPNVYDGGDSTTLYDEVTSGGDSATIFPAAAPIVQGYIDGQPCPRVQVNVAEVAAGTVTATLHRIYGNNDDIVPGADGIASVSGFVRTDYYPPIGTPIAYRVEMFNGNGASLGFTDAATIILDVPPSTAWITSPYDPTKSVQIELDDEASSQLAKTIVSSSHLIGGRRIVISEAAYGYAGIPMSFWVTTVAEARAVEDVFLDGLGLVVIRVAPPMEVPRVLYAYGVPSRQEVNLPAGIEDAFFALTVDEASAPTTVIIVAVIPYARFTNNLTTYGAFTQMYGTYRDALLNPPAEV